MEKELLKAPLHFHNMQYQKHVPQSTAQFLSLFELLKVIYYIYSAREYPYKVKKREIIQSGCRKLYELCREYSLPVKRMLWDTDESKEWRGHIKGIDDLYYDLCVNQTDKTSQRL